MFATLLSASIQGIEAEPVEIEVNAGEIGEPRLVLVGLPDAAVRESEDRVCSALSNSGFRPPRTHTTINLAPGHLRKEGPLYDLPIALGILVATGRLQAENVGGLLIAGELSLSGETRPVRGALAIAMLARRLGLRGLLLPPESAAEAACADALPVHAVHSLAQAHALLSVNAPLPVLRNCGIGAGRASPGPDPADRLPGDASDFSELRGQRGLRRALEVAVAGGHNALILGVPGSGKSMAAKCLPSILPTPSPDEYLDILRIHSTAGLKPPGSPSHPLRPFRSPHQSATEAALLGGGAIIRPGEITLAHHGVLFLDELPEFRRSTLEVLRQPIEDGRVMLARSTSRMTLPCAFTLVAAMNPCPCGHLGDPRRRCRCTPAQIERYRARISGPLLDRIDVHVEAPAVSIADLRSTEACESSAAIRARVEAARRRQAERYGRGKVAEARQTGPGAAPRTGGTAGWTTAGGAGGFSTPGSGGARAFSGSSFATAGNAAVNARMTRAQIREFCALPTRLGDLLQHAMEKLHLSARAYDRILKVARTVADVEGAEKIGEAHLLEAIQYRSLDREIRE